MDPDSGAKQAASQILKSTCIIVSFTACQGCKTETATPVTNISLSLPHPIVRTVKEISTEKKKKTIYLTFDDGPNKGTKKVMHIIDQEEIMVSAFVVGEHVYDSKEQKKAFDSLMINPFFEIANHSFTHANNKYEKFYTKPDSVVKDFIRCADSLHLTTRIVRTPGRNIWRMKNISVTDVWKNKPAADSVHAKGFTEVGWDLEWQFDNELKLKTNSDEMVQQVDNMFTYAKTKIPGHLIILAHDQVYSDAADSVQLHQFIQKLKATNKYEFKKISTYPGI